jgi:hypothetical protein
MVIVTAGRTVVIIAVLKQIFTVASGSIILHKGSFPLKDEQP